MSANAIAGPPTTATDKLILTASLDAPSQEHFNELREAFFPPEINYLQAHLTLFHALPAKAVQAMWPSFQSALAAACPMPFRAVAPYALGRGVAIAIECPQLLAVKKTVRALCEQHGVELSAQDRHQGRLHITVQNKVSPQDAKRTLQALSMVWNSERTGTVIGYGLHAYRGGPWEPLAEITPKPN